MEKQWYFNTVTEQPELGMISPASHRMRPYRTREDALDVEDRAGTQSQMGGTGPRMETLVSGRLGIFRK